MSQYFVHVKTQILSAYQLSQFTGCVTGDMYIMVKGFK
jgi:hypothetical protein